MDNYNHNNFNNITTVAERLLLAIHCVRDKPLFYIINE